MKKMSDCNLDIMIDISFCNKDVLYAGFKMTELSLKKMSSVEIAAAGVSKQFERILLEYLKKHKNIGGAE